MFSDIYYVILDIFSLFVAPHSKEEQGSQEDVGCLLNFFPQVILDTFYMIFMFLLQGGIPKKSKAVGWRRLPHSLALLGLTFPFAQGQPALPYRHHHLCFFPHNDYPGKSSFCFFPAPWLSRTITSSLSSSSPVLSLTSSYRLSFFVFNINQKTCFDFPFFWGQLNRSCLCPKHVHPFEFSINSFTSRWSTTFILALIIALILGSPQLTIFQCLTIEINRYKFCVVSR